MLEVMIALGLSESYIPLTIVNDYALTDRVQVRGVVSYGPE